MEEFAKNLKRIRNDNGFTQEELAKRAGVNPMMVYFYERGQKVPSVMLLLRFSEILGCTANDLLYERKLA